jgi:1-acyl-sn-glycerol-3-phosphate acyltransferase
LSYNFSYTLADFVIRAYAKVMLRMDIQLHNPLPPGPRIFVANHPSAMDPFLIHALIPGQVSVLITKSAFDVPVFGAFIRKSGQIPVVGLGDRALEEACQVLKDGGSVAIFPEGTFSPREGGFQRPRTGAARLALMSGASVVPLGIHLLRERSLTIRSQIKGKNTEGYWYLYGPYHVTIGNAMQFEGDVADRKRLQEVAAVIMTRIQALASESQGRVRKPRLVQAPA